MVKIDIEKSNFTISSMPLAFYRLNNLKRFVSKRRKKFKNQIKPKTLTLKESKNSRISAAVPMKTKRS